LQFEFHKAGAKTNGDRNSVMSFNLNDVVIPGPLSPTFPIWATYKSSNK